MFLKISKVLINRQKSLVGFIFCAYAWPFGYIDITVSALYMLSPVLYTSSFYSATFPIIRVIHLASIFCRTAINIGITYSSIFENWVFFHIEPVDSADIWIGDARRTIRLHWRWAIILRRLKSRYFAILFPVYIAGAPILQPPLLDSQEVRCYLNNIG